MRINEIINFIEASLYFLRKYTFSLYIWSKPIEMPQNKLALQRYKILDKAFRNHGRKWTLKDLIAEVNKVLMENEGIQGVSKRTIQLDIQHMRSDQLGFNAPIEVYDRKYYRYKDKDYSILEQAFSKEDERMFTEAIEVLKQLRPFTQFSEFTSIITKLDAKQSDQLSDSKYIQLDHNSQTKGLNWINTITTALKDKNVLRIEYQSFKAEEASILEVNPYILKEYNNRWFMLGALVGKSKLQLFALDRIKDMEIWYIQDYETYRLSLDNYFNNCIGVSKKEVNEKTIKVIFEISTDQFPYIDTKPIHSSQEVLEVGESEVKLSLDVVHNYELERELLSFSPHIKILEPLNLRDKIQQKLELSLKRYN